MRRSLLKTITAVAVAAAAVGIATPASAYSFPSCDVTLMNPDASACTGYFSGNFLNNSHITEQQNGIAALPSSFTWDGNWNDPDLLKINAEDGDSPIDFGITLFGETIIGVHWGNVGEMRLGLEIDPLPFVPGLEDGLVVPTQMTRWPAALVAAMASTVAGGTK